MPRANIQSILCVDDDPDICEVVQATLCLVGGFDVQTVRCGEQAIDLAYESRPDLILMDVMMPGLDGPSTFGRMREHALLAHIPVIFLTAKALPAEAARLLRLGAIGVIGKPLDPLTLCDEVSALWGKADAARETESIPAGQARVQEQVVLLSENFLRRTRKDIVRLRSIIERARRGDRPALLEAQRIAHSIHGAAAMFGFPDVSATGGAIERLVERVLASNAAHDPACEPAVLQQLLDFTGRLANGVDPGKQAAQASAGMFRG
jgi:two-component system OmpR family response regulator